ncbi:hypothetical protein A4G18_02140 [Pasteurellaceae bacterium Pebbles2]|nr:hypothetical protein [Pasteurellaceae bacterium Pebbles2]
MLTNELWDKFQIGIDVFTAISIIFAAAQYIRNSRKEAEKLREERAKETEKQRAERIAESGAKVLSDEIRSLSEYFTKIVRESKDVEKLSQRFIQQHYLKETDEEFYLRSEKMLIDTDLHSRYSKELEEFRIILLGGFAYLSQRNYVILPVLDAISKANDLSGLVEKVKAVPSAVNEKYNQFIDFPDVWSKLVELYQLTRNLPADLSFEHLIEQRQEKPEYEQTLQLLIKISRDDDYLVYLSNVLYTQDDLKENLQLEQDLTQTDLRLFNAQHLYQLCMDNKLPGIIHNVNVRGCKLIDSARDEFKGMLILLSACYSYILNADEHISLDSEISRYEEIFKLGEEIS